MGNTLVGHVCTTPDSEHVTAVVAAVHRAGVTSQIEENVLSQHQSALARARQSGDDPAAAAFEGAVQYWTKRASCSRKVVDALCAQVVLLLDCVVEDMDGLYLSPAKKQLFLDRHAGLRTAEATRLADEGRACASKMYQDDQDGYGWRDGSPTTTALKEAHAAARRARLWGDADAVEATSRVVRHLLARWWASNHAHFSLLSLRNVKNERTCACSVCSRRTTGDSSGGESDAPPPPELFSRAGSGVSSSSSSGDAGGHGDAGGGDGAGGAVCTVGFDGVGGGDDASVLLLPPAMVLSGDCGTHPRRGFLPGQWCAGVGGLWHSSGALRFQGGRQRA